MDKDALDIGKIMFDQRIMKLLHLLDKNSMSIKELAKEIGEPTANLYYPINKLLELDLIRVVREERIKNMIERYYSSNHFIENNAISYEGELIKGHYNKLVKAVMLEFNKALLNLQDDLNSVNTNKASVEFSFIEKKLSFQKWKELNKYIRDFIDEHEKEHEDKDSENTYRFLITSYKE